VNPVYVSYCIGGNKIPGTDGSALESRDGETTGCLSFDLDARAVILNETA
jgi:hypothetical protein